MVSGKSLCVTLTTLFIAALMATSAVSAHAAAQTYRILVVMSYDEVYHWERDIRQGIEDTLADLGELRFFYMDTKRHLDGGEKKAREAFELYEAFKPHGVIAADDNAQSLFVVPYLRNRVETPVIFCGVNSTPDAYGYPARNVTGVLERDYFRETIAFAQLIKPDIHTACFLMNTTPTTAVLKEQITKEMATYPVEIPTVDRVRTFSEALEATDRLRPSCDALVLTNLSALSDGDGTPMTEKDLLGPLAKRFGKVTLGSIPSHVEYGALLTVANSGIEQGTLAARMLHKCLRGTPISDLPITRNRKGQRIINLKMMEALGIKPVPAALVGVSFYEGE